MNGFRRPDGSVAVRNHVLVLPSVVCSSHAAGRAAQSTAAVAITHQRGCLHVGDDLAHTASELIAVATSPNVAAVVVLSLGCETLNGKGLADRIRVLGQRTELVGIQHEGGTRRAVEAGRRLVEELCAETAAQPAAEIDPRELTIGIDNPSDPLGTPVATALRSRGVRVVLAPESRRGAEAHVALSGLGAHLIVSVPAEDEGPVGFAVAPVVAVGCGSDLHRALADDFDVMRGSGESASALADRVADHALRHAAGEETAAERRGARDVVLRRLAVTM